MEYKELINLLKTENTAEEINKHRDEIAEIIPQVRIMFDYDQKNYAHQYDLWMHCLHTVINLERNMDDDMLYLAALLHDIGKPDCQVAGNMEGDTNMHYFGHPERSAEIVQDEILKTLYERGVRLTFDEQKRLVYFVKYHDDYVSLKMKHLRRHLKMVDIEDFKKLMLLQIADAKAHVMYPFVKERIEVCGKLSGPYADYLQQQMLEGL